MTKDWGDEDFVTDRVTPPIREPGLATAESQSAR
jgi:hypothetical protein